MTRRMQTSREGAMHLWFWLRERWIRFFFKPVGPRNLGLCRVLFFGVFFLLYLPQDFSAWAYVGVSFFDPIVLFEFLHLPVLPSDLLLVVQDVWKVSLALSCLGLLTRISTMSSLILGVYLLGLENNFGKIHESETLVVICFGILALSRCGDAYSIDRLISRWRQGSDLTVVRPRMSGDYTWPVRTVWVVFTLIFFAAGVSKLRHSGLEWIFSDNLAISLIMSGYHVSDAEPLVTWGLYIAQYVWLTRLLAAGSLVLELSCPLALFSSKARWIIVPSILLLLIGFRVFLGPTFVPQYLICSLFWVPWDRVSIRLVERFRELSSRKSFVLRSTANKLKSTPDYGEGSVGQERGPEPR
jgi:hypothetical protein